MAEQWSIANALKRKPANFNRMTRIMLEEAGWTVELSQSFNAVHNLSKDLFGFADLIAFLPNSSLPPILIQACGTGDRTKRLRKIFNIKAARDWVNKDYREIWLIHWNNPQRSANSTGKWHARIEIIKEKAFEHFYSTGEVPQCPKG